MKALVLAGGLGTRLRPLTQTGAKQLLPVANKPIIHYVLENLREAGIADVAVVVGAETSTGIRQNLGDGSRWELNITYLHQENPLGLAHCVILAEKFLREDPFVMYLGDNLMKGGIKPLSAAFHETKSAASILLYEVPNPTEFGVAEFDDNGRLKAIVEKPDCPPSNWVITGIYFFDHHIIEAAHAIKPSWRNELEITDAIQWLIEGGLKVDYTKLPGWWKDTGQAADLLEANVLVLQDLRANIDDSASVDNESQIIGEVEIGPDVEITRSVIRGPVIIGAGSKIENSFVGASTSLGQGCLLRNCEISCSIVMEGAQILDAPDRIDWSLIGREAVVYRSEEKPKALNLILGDVSRVGLA